MAHLKFMPLMAARLIRELPEGDEWEYEAKLDGSPYTQTVIRYLRRCDLSMASRSANSPHALMGGRLWTGDS